MEEIGTINGLLENIINFSDISLQSNKGGIKAIVIDDFAEASVSERIDQIQKMMKSADDSEIFIFVNSMGKYVFYSYQEKWLYDNVIPIVVTKEKTSLEYNYFDEKDEVFYIFTKNSSVREKILKMEDKVKFEKCGLEIRIQKLSDESLRIKVLEGQLKATETRLLEYIKKEQEEKNK